MADSFGTRLYDLRMEHGVSQEELARRLGHKRNTQVSLWENDHRLPEPFNIVRIAKALGVSTRDLLLNVETYVDRLRANKPLLVRPKKSRRGRATVREARARTMAR